MTIHDRNEILTELSKIQVQHDVQILYACEAGSRAWGFESADSDYDVRFIYAHPRDWYLSIQDRRDVIELPPGELDINGWDLRKALQLYRKSNPPLMEWLGSPTVYVERMGLAEVLRAWATTYYSRTAASYHYLHMALGNYREYLRGPEVWRKKYLYLIRPLLAVKYLQFGLPLPPPVRIEDLIRPTITGPVNEAIWRLVDAKRAGEEMGRGPAIPTLSHFIQEELAKWEGHRFTKTPKLPPAGQLDELFREVLEKL